MPSTQSGLPEFIRIAMLNDADRLEKLASDLRRIAKGEAPLPSDLMAAPSLDQWEVRHHPVAYLTGIGSRHPKLPDGRIFTSDLRVMAPDHSWARTTSRFYVLGKRAAQSWKGEGGFDIPF
jgi:hypothetical protein